MSIEGLLEELKKEKDDEISRLKEEAIKMKKTIYKDTQKKVQDMEENFKREYVNKREKMLNSAINNAKSKGIINIINEENEFSKRIEKYSIKLLITLREKDYNTIFKKLVMELPKYAWENIIVSPDDVPAAKHFFPKANIESNNSIIGGLKVESKNREIAIDNTLNKRFEKICPIFMPVILKYIYTRENIDTNIY